MDGPNDYTRRILAAADEHGWMVLEFSLQRPGYVVLGDGRGGEIRIETEYGLRTEEYIRQLTPVRDATPSVFA